MRITPVILAGGSGTRLFPISSEDVPKQFFRLGREYSLFQKTILRALLLEKYEIVLNKFLIVINEKHRFLVTNQLIEINCKGYISLLESLSLNTSPALTFAMLANNKFFKDSLAIVMPADHFFNSDLKFASSVANIIKKHNIDRILLLGVKPKCADRSLGYIIPEEEIKGINISIAKDFIEKPKIKNIPDLIARGSLWNLGIFILNSNLWIAKYSKYYPKSFEKILQVISFRRNYFNFVYLNLRKSDLEIIKSISIDKAIIEREVKFSNISVAKLDLFWNDLGKLDTFVDFYKNQNSNFLQSVNSDSIIFSEDKNIYLDKISNLVIFSTNKATLIFDKRRLKDHKYLTNDSKTINLLNIVYRPWGFYENISQDENYLIKKITLNPLSSISLQFHEYRSETWTVVEGVAHIIINKNKFILKKNQSIFVNKKTIHKLSNHSRKNNLVIIETQTGSFLSETDIFRLEDQYMRDTN